LPALQLHVLMVTPELSFPVHVVQLVFPATLATETLALPSLYVPLAPN